MKRVDLSIINDEDWFIVEVLHMGTFIAKCDIITRTTGSHVFICLKTGEIDDEADYLCDERNIKSIRLATKNEIEKHVYRHEKILFNPDSDLFKFR